MGKYKTCMVGVSIMKKIHSLLKVFIMCSFILLSIVLSQGPQKVNLIYNDSNFDAYIISNISYLSKENLSYIIGKPVIWDSKEKVIIIDNIRIYSKIAIYKGELLVSLKETLTPLGYQIKWDQYTKIITIIPPLNKKEENKAKVKIEENENKYREETKNKENSKNYEIPLNNFDNRNSDKYSTRGNQSFQIVFIPRSAFNEEYKVTVSDLKEAKVYKGMYNSQSGYKFVIISVSQQNLSNKVQLYTGKFVLFDEKNIRYEYIEGLSSYILQILMPMGINFGTLVFEIPETSIPSKLMLETYGSTPIIVNLL